jgi:predicted enzyme related to lactoylglutathione lyase
MINRTFAWGATTAAYLTLSLAGAQQPSHVGDQPAASKALMMLGATVPVSNLDRSLVFYTKGLGMLTTSRMDQKEVIEVPLNFPGGGPYLVLIWSKAPPTAPGSPPPTQRVILDVPDLKALETQLQANGYQLKGPIHEIPQYHTSVAQLEDPDGNHIELVQRAH